MHKKRFLLKVVATLLRSKLYVFPDDVGKPEVHLISYKYTGPHRERMREQLLKGGLRLGHVLNSIFQ